MAELIMSIMIVLTLMPIITVSLSSLGEALSFDEIVMDELAIEQLRRILLVAYDFEVEDEQLIFRYQDSERFLRMVNNKIIIQPGTLIFITDVDNACFYEEDNVIYLQYEKYENTAQVALIYK